MFNARVYFGLMRGKRACNRFRCNDDQARNLEATQTGFFHEGEPEVQSTPLRSARLCHCLGICANPGFTDTFERIITKDCQFSDGFIVPRGTQIDVMVLEGSAPPLYIETTFYSIQLIVFLTVPSHSSNMAER